MKLTEAEGKLLLSTVQLSVPASQLVTPKDIVSNFELNSNLEFPVVVKAQVLQGNRGLSGLIKTAENYQQLLEIIKELLAQNDANGNPIESVLVETQVAFESEEYISLSYDTHFRGLVARYSAAGGQGMDDRGDQVASTKISLLTQPSEFTPNPDLLPVVAKLWELIKNHDVRLVEINPIVKDTNGTWICLDAKIELDEVAAFRHPEWESYPARSGMGRPPTAREEQAHQVSRSDHRGAAGESFFEFENGEIGVLAAGGGASVVAMDALLAENIKPANYTEHSGNPPREKVKALTDVILSIPNLKGLFVVGTNANFTDIYETMAGMLDSLLASEYANNPQFCLLIRRGGPRWEEAFTMIRERLASVPIKYQLFGPNFPIVQTALEMKKMLESAQS